MRGEAHTAASGINAPIWERMLGKVGETLLREILLDLRGDPRLTRWEEEFLADHWRNLHIYGPRMVVTEKQRAVLLQLQEKIAGPIPDEPDPDLEDEPLDLD